MKREITYVVGIGNSDDKLSQKRWSDYIDGLGLFLAQLEIDFPEAGVDIHFFGFSNPAGAWQSCSTVFNADSRHLPVAEIQTRLKTLAAEFGQDSIALTIGATTLVKGA